NAFLAHVNTGSIEVGGDLRVSTELINVKAFVCGSLSFYRGRGSIRGGTLFVQNDLDVYELGSELGVSTTVHLGHFEVCRRQLKSTQSDLLDLKDQIRVLSEGMGKLNSGTVAASMSRKKQNKAVEKLTSALEQLEIEKRELESEAIELESEMEKYRPCFVRVEGTIYPGVRIHVGKAEFQVTKAMKKVEFYMNPGTKEIKHRPYRAKVNKES
ncbi:DUF342 domain-containing protein, partial [bacterium]|nr:DUF342 domain-containing protein [bacterium]